MIDFLTSRAFLDGCTALLILGAAIFAVLLIRQRGVWNLGHALGDWLARMSVRVHRLMEAGDYACQVFQFRYRHLRAEEVER